VPLDRAAIQHSLGVALQCLGERESATARLEDAVSAFRAALTERTREHVQLQSTTTESVLDGALDRLGSRKSASQS